MRDRVHSPKGRASLMKTWLRQQGDVLGEEQAIQSQSVFQNVMQQLFLRLQAAPTREQDDFSHQVHDAMPNTESPPIGSISLATSQRKP